MLYSMPGCSQNPNWDHVGIFSRSSRPGYCRRPEWDSVGFLSNSWSGLCRNPDQDYVKIPTSNMLYIWPLFCGNPGSVYIGVNARMSQYRRGFFRTQYQDEIRNQAAVMSESFQDPPDRDYVELNARMQSESTPRSCRNFFKVLKSGIPSVLKLGFCRNKTGTRNQYSVGIQTRAFCRISDLNSFGIQA